MRASGASFVVAMVLVACATTQPTRSVTPSGFLGDYAGLEKGREGQAALLYIDPSADFGGYERVVVDAVTAWLGPGTQLADVPQDDLERLVQYLDVALREQLATQFEVVERPDSGTLRIRVAITEAEGSKPVLDVASTVLPPARVLSQIKKLATGTHAFVGRAAVEVEVLDAVSNRRLIAAVDERAGGKTLAGSTGTWSDVEAAFDAWARVITARLATFRALDAPDPGGGAGSSPP